MNKQTITLIAVFIIFSAIQLTIAPVISVSGIQPVFPAIFVTYYSLLLKNNRALLLGFFAGLFFDLISGGVTGVYAFALTLTAFISTRNKNKFTGNEIASFKFLWLVFFTSSIASFTINFLYGFTVNIFYAFFFYGIIAGLYTALFAAPILFLIPEKKLDE